jgi:redox-sensitive bicupin YhaK (pirin superfamily)
MTGVDIEQIVTGRPRDLGGLHVARVLPAIHKRSVGPYVFLDHMGPEPAGEISVRPHPHIHLATVTYLFDGAIHHRDSLGSHQVIEPGAINWMNAGKGIVHSERSERRLDMHGLQLWVGLPSNVEDSEPTFTHYAAATMPALDVDGAKLRVLVGSAFGKTSPVETKSPMLYLDVRLGAGGTFQVPGGYEERAVYVVDGDATVGGTIGDPLEPRQLAVLARGATPVLHSVQGARFVILGGEPLDGPRYVWWNFVSSDKDRILAAAHAWREGRFPTVPGDDKEFIPAPDDDPHWTTQ